MQFYSRSLLLMTLAAAMSATTADAARTPTQLALSDILRCSPVTEPAPGQAERVALGVPHHGREHAGAYVFPADIYDPNDCARSEEDYAADESAAGRIST